MDMPKNTNSFYEALSMGIQVITPNRRLAVRLKSDYHYWQQQILAKTAYPEPAIYPLSEWTLQQWRELQKMRTHSLPWIINDHESLLIWRTIILNQTKSSPLLNTEGCAQKVQEAWQFMWEWQCSDWQSLVMHEAGEQFYQWQKLFRSHLKRCHAITEVEVREQLIQAIKNKTFSLPSVLYFIGFLELTPQLKSLFEVHRRQGGILWNENILEKNGESYLVGAPDQESEWRMMAQWAKQSHLAGQKNIACVINNLEKFHPMVMRVFQDVLNADTYEFVVGKPLAIFPLVITALNLLKIFDENTAVNAWRQLLTSPYLNPVFTQSREASFLLARFLEYREMTIPQHMVVSWLNQAPVWKDAWHTSKKLIANQNQTFKEWFKIFLQIWQRWGWPDASISLNSEEYQCYQRFLTVAEECYRLEKIINDRSFLPTVNYWHQVLTKIMFQPQSKESAIQIFGLGEGLGLTFDAMWISGLDQDAWPRRALPNPFIPIPLQRRYQMPRASAAIALNFSKKVTHHFTKAAALTIFSYAQQEADRNLTPSALIANYPAYPDALSHCLKLPLTFQNALESIADEQGPTLNTDEKTTSGAILFKLQAHCAFQSFVRLRLHAEPFSASSLSKWSAERGRIVHRALELIGQEISSYEILHALNCDQQEQIIEKIIKKLQQEIVIEQSIIPPQFYDLEIERLKDILKNWLALEKTRPPFKVVAQEVKQTLEIGGLEIHTRVDRIDELADGTQLIIDYKTGKVSAGKWFGECLQEPQLPLYSLQSGMTSAISFAVVNKETCMWEGVAAKDIDVPGIQSLADCQYSPETLWSAQLHLWQEQLTHLVNDFREGRAAIAPRTPRACDYCPCATVCRYHWVDEKPTE